MPARRRLLTPLRPSLGRGVGLDRDGCTGTRSAIDHASRRNAAAPRGFVDLRNGRHDDLDHPGHSSSFAGDGLRPELAGASWEPLRELAYEGRGG
jgi:hypothetical protein